MKKEVVVARRERTFGNAAVEDGVVDVVLQLPERVVRAVQEDVDSSGGLFEDFSDYVLHCISFWRRGGS